jgi:lipoprotein NlpI
MIFPFRAERVTLAGRWGGNMNWGCLHALLSAALIAATVLPATLPADAQTQQQLDWCKEGITPDLKIGGCTAVIQSGKYGGTSLAAVFYLRGTAYGNKGQYDRASRDYDQATRLNPQFAEAFYDLGNSYQSMKDFDRAIANYNEAIRLNPEYAFAFYYRGNAYANKGDYERAIEDFDQAVRLNPKADYNYLGRALAYLYSGAPAKALADVSQASELNPKNAYNALWVDIVKQRSNIPSSLSTAVSRIDMTAWPAPLIRMFLGQTTPAAALAAADGDNSERMDRMCRANFYSGALALRKGKPQEALRLFRSAERDCRRILIEWNAANAELRVLGATH